MLCVYVGTCVPQHSHCGADAFSSVRSVTETQVSELREHLDRHRSQDPEVKQCVLASYQVIGCSCYGQGRFFYSRKFSNKEKSGGGRLS